MSQFAFQVGGIAFLLEGDSELLRTFEFLYGKFDKPNNPNLSCTLCWSERVCTWRAGDQPAQTVKVQNSKFRVSATTSLIARLLTNFIPNSLIFHGNALLHQPSGRLLLLMGDSGAGKTTLTLKTLEYGSDWTAFAEDVLLIDFDQQTLYPFPRAFSVRTGNHLPHDVYLGEIFSSDEIKRWRPHPGEVRGPASLEGATVALLSRSLDSSDFTPPPNAPKGEVTWVTSAGEESLDRLRQAGLPLVACSASMGLDRLVYARRLESEERLVQARILEFGGGMILQTETLAQAEAPAAPPRPGEPHLEPLVLSTGIQRSLRLMVRPTMEFASQPAGRLFMDASRAFQSTTFIRFVPGGTPEQSAKALLDAIVLT